MRQLLWVIWVIFGGRCQNLYYFIFLFFLTSFTHKKKNNNNCLGWDGKIIAAGHFALIHQFPLQGRAIQMGQRQLKGCSPAGGCAEEWGQGWRVWVCETHCSAAQAHTRSITATSLAVVFSVGVLLPTCCRVYLSSFVLLLGKRGSK